MNIERLHRVAQLVLDELSEGATSADVSHLRDGLQAVSANPADGSGQQLISQSITHMRQTLPVAPSNNWPPSDRDIIDEIGISDVLGQRLLDRVDEVLARNQMTPSIALSEIDPIRERLDEVMAALTTLVQGLTFFEIGRDDVVDEYEVGIDIPRQEVGNSLPVLGRDFVEWQKILAPFEELAGLGVSDYRVRAISSSDFGLFLAAVPAVALFITKAVNGVLDAYLKLLNIKRMRSEMAAEVPEDRLSSIDEYANVVMAQDLTSIARDLVAESSVSDEGRKNELEVAVKWSLNKIANRVDAGYSIDIRTPPLPPEPQSSEEGEVDKAELAAFNQAREIKQLADRVKRLEARGSRILELPEGDEGGSAPALGGSVPAS
jgi:hypothetical protein